MGEIFAPAPIKNELAEPDVAFYCAMNGEKPVGYIKLNYRNKQTIFQGKEKAKIECIICWPPIIPYRENIQQ